MPVDVDRAVTYLKAASRQGDPTAKLALGYCCQHGLGVERNASAALEFYQSVANKHEESGFYTAELLLTSDQHEVKYVGVGGSEVHTDTDGHAVHRLTIISSFISFYQISNKKKEIQALNVAHQFYMSSANRGHILSMHRYLLSIYRYHMHAPSKTVIFVLSFDQNCAHCAAAKDLSGMCNCSELQDCR